MSESHQLVGVVVSLIKDGFPDITLYYGGGLRKVRAEGSLRDLGVVPSNHLFPYLH